MGKQIHLYSRSFEQILNLTLKLITHLSLMILFQSLILLKRHPQLLQQAEHSLQCPYYCLLLNPIPIHMNASHLICYINQKTPTVQLLFFRPQSINTLYSHDALYLEHGTATIYINFLPLIYPCIRLVISMQSNRQELNSPNSETPKQALIILQTPPPYP